MDMDSRSTLHTGSSIQRRVARKLRASQTRPIIAIRERKPTSLTPSCSILNSNGRLLIDDDRDLNVVVMSSRTRGFRSCLALFSSSKNL